MRKLTKEEIQIFKFLNNLRNSGATNMFGATPYIVDEFEVSKSFASKVLSLWMGNFNEDDSMYDSLEVND